MTSPPDPQRLRVLHALRLVGFADTEVIARRTGLPDSVVVAALVPAEQEGLARRREGRMPGWILTADGRAEGERLLAAELQESGGRDVIAAAYRRFLGQNGELLSVCTAWQVRDENSQRLNDHADLVYDAAVVERLAAVDAGIRPVCADLAAELDRFSGYAERFAAAIDRVRAGEKEWFAKPLIDSYHTVWFELHEDLLATLGLDRAKA
jgi:hypothetical protein